jgi:peptidoglycan/xylan/chitin deacetylase (PgdA/CDA1 family)
MIFYTVNPLIQKLLHKNIWTTNNNKLLLTFDDGPVPGNTEKILNWLNNKQIKALFFCVGNNVKNNLPLAKRILSDGHMIGSHTYNHKLLYKLKDTEIRNELNEFNKVVKDNFNYDVQYFRPPHGRIIPGLHGILSDYNMRCVLWSLITYDFNNDINIVKFALENKLKNNSIVVFHDSLKSKDIIIESLDYFYSEVKKKGYEIGDPDKCLS